MSRDRFQIDRPSLTAVPVDALLIVDMQNYFLKDHRYLVPRVAELTKSFPAERTWWLKYRNVPGSSFVKRLYWSDMMVAPDTDIEPSLKPLAKNIIEHESYLPTQEVVTVLQGCKYVAIAGMDSEACIYATALFLWQHDMFPVILEDHCNSSGGQNFHRPALDMMRRSFGVEAIVSGITPSPSALRKTGRPSLQSPAPP